jgi:hypothetical protein
MVMPLGLLHVHELERVLGDGFELDSLYIQVYYM